MIKRHLSILTLMLFLCTTLPKAFASEEVKVSVKGMVCAYCSSGVEKSFNKQKEVQTVKVDLDNKLVELVFKENLTMNDEEITKVITKAGLNVESINRVKN